MILDSLAKSGYTAHHDVPLRGYGNIDHVVVGRGGVFTVETKNTSGSVRARGRGLRVGGRRVEHVAQARRQAKHIRTRIGEGMPITPLLGYTRARIDIGWFGLSRVNGVEIVGPRALPRRIVRAASVLDSAAVARINSILQPVPRQY